MSVKPLSIGALQGVRVLDLTRVLAGPTATMMLADMGADVLKIERREGGDDTRTWGPPFLNGGACRAWKGKRKQPPLSFPSSFPSPSNRLLSLSTIAYTVPRQM